MDDSYPCHIEVVNPADDKYPMFANFNGKVIKQVRLRVISTPISKNLIGKIKVVKSANE